MNTNNIHDKIEELPDLSSIQKDFNETNDKNDDNIEVETKKIDKNEDNNIEKPIVDDVIKKRGLIMKIQAYNLNFEKYLPQDLHSVDYRQFTIEQLETLLKEMQFTVACRNSGKMSERVFKNILNQVENGLCTFTPVKAEGLHLIAENQDLVDTWTEFTLENMNMFYVPAKWRLLYAVVSAIGNLHMINSLKEKENINLSKPMNDKLNEINNKFQIKNTNIIKV